MQRASLLALILLAATLTGCAADEEGPLEPVEVEWTQEPEDMDTAQAIDVAWRLVGPEREIQHTGLHWADFSVSDPQSPADYGNASGVSEPAQVPGDYDTTVSFDEEGTYHFRAHAIVDGEHRWTPEVSIQVNASGPAEPPVIVTVDDHTSEADVGQNISVNWSLTGAPDRVQHTGFHWATFSVSDPQSPADYGNASGVVEPAEVPGSYNATFTEDEAGTYHGRAHAIYNGQHYWSDEVTIEVQGSGNQTAGNETGATHHVVEMRDANGPFRFEPAELNVSPGDTINWTNVGAVTHTATFNDTDNGTDSGDVAPGDWFNWTVPEDMPPGTYDYRCIYHSTDFSTGMVGEITVQAAANDTGS